MRPTSNDTARRFGDIDTVADYLHTSRRHTEALMRDAGLPYYHVGRLVRIDLDELDQWLATRRGGAA